MSEPEIIRLKKEIYHLKELNSNLQQDLEEKRIKIGEFQAQLLNTKNKSLLAEEANIALNKETMLQAIEEALIEEKTKFEETAKENEQLKEKLSFYEREKQGLDSNIQALYEENMKIKKQLIEFGKKHEANDFIDNIRIREDALIKKDQEYQKIVAEWNELRDKMEEVLSENRLLRQIADVPENFGIDITKIKMGDRVKIEDYKGKIRLLQREIDDLETERAQLKNKMLFLGNTVELKERPFSMLTTEQKIEVARYAQCLYEGKELIVPTQYELLKEIRDLKQKIEILEKHNTDQRISDSIRIPNYSVNKGFESKGGDFNEIIDVLRQENNDLKKLLQASLEKFNNFDYNRIDNMGGEGIGKGGIGNNYGQLSDSGFHSNKKGLYTSSRLQQQDIDKVVDLSMLQMPPIPFIDSRNVDNTTHGGSYRFNSKFKINKDQIHQLFGIAVDETDPDNLKRESAALQCQILELLEINSRMRKEDESFNENILKIFNKLEHLVLIQNELFERYSNERKKANAENEKNRKANSDLLTEINSIKRVNKAYEETIVLIERKNMSEIERKMIEKIKENAIIENANMKLIRKYECLVEEEQKQREYIDLTEKNSIEKDTQLQSTIAKLKEWKGLLTYYLKFLVKKLKASVAKDEFDKVVEENKYFREKYNEITLRDISVTRVMAVNETFKIKIRELETNYYICEEMKLDVEIESNYLKKHIQEIDPQFFLEQKAFRRFASRLSEQKVSFDDIKKAFSPLNKDEITKSEFIEGLNRLGLTEYLNQSNQNNQTELNLILRVLQIDEDLKIEMRYLIKLLEQNCIDETKEAKNDNMIFEQFIDCVRTSNQSLISIFEHFDTNNNGKITREEFIFALRQMKFPVSDDMINKLIIIVNGNDSELKASLDTFNYIEFCDLFDQKSKSYQLRKKRSHQVKNNLKIDAKMNSLSEIVEAMQVCQLKHEKAFLFLDKTKNNYLTLEEFGIFVRSLNTHLSTEEIRNLFNMFDPQATSFVLITELIEALKDTEKKIETYKMMSNPIYKNESMTIVDINRKYYMLLEEKNYFNHKMNQMRMRIEDLERTTKDTSTKLENYVKKNTDLTDKYFSQMNELQQLKEVYASTGVKREDINRIEGENDSLTREVTILRIGMNTFKELYNSSNRQIKMISIKQTKALDELDTFKKAVKELQSVSNQNALIGKLYYSLLISRWRESNSLRKYDDYVGDFSSMKEDNFQLETQNKRLTKDLTEIQTSLHEKIIENIRINDQLENYIRGFVVSKAEAENHPLEEMKKLVKLLTHEKSEMTETIIKQKKTIVTLENQNEHLHNQIDFCQNLADKIKRTNNDDYSKKIIEMCEEISELRINLSVANRENKYYQENEGHLQRLNNQLTVGIKEHEIKTAEWESKFRQMEEVYRTKDEERQRKLIESLEKLKIYQPNEIQAIIKGQALRDSQMQSLTPQQTQFALEAKVKELTSIISIKDNEIEALSKMQNDNTKVKQDASKFYDVNSVQNLVGQSGYDLLKDDETKLIAQTAHKTIKTLQDMLSVKNDALRRKDAEIEMLHDDNIKMKEYYLKLVNSLQDQIHADHNATLKKLNNVLDTTNANISHKFSRNDLSLMTVNDIEKLIIDKDNAIKALGLELKIKNEENENNYILINDLNKKMADMQLDNRSKEISRRNNDYNDDIEQLKKVIAQKNDEINYEKQKIQKVTMEFQKKYEDRAMFEEEKLDNTVGVPERLIINKEKSDLFVKINQLRKKNKTLIEERDKLHGLLKEKDQTIVDLNTKITKAREENKSLLEFQVKDTRNISNLKKEKEKQKMKLDELKDEIEKLKAKINSNEEEKQKEKSKQTAVQKNKDLYSHIKDNVDSVSLDKGKNDMYNSLKDNVESIAQSQSQSMLTSQIVKLKVDSLIEKKPSKEIVKESQVNYSKRADEDALLKLVYYCIKKNINMTKQMQRYDISKDGKITTEDFQKSIEELKFGFIDSDIKQLITLTNPINGYITIRDFTKMLTDKDMNYANFMKEQEESRIGDKKVTTKKYNPFENKSFNINY